MFQFGLAIASGDDTVKVANTVADRALSQNSTPNFALLFSSMQYDQIPLFETLRRRLGNIPIFGTTSTILISNRGAEFQSVLLLLVTNPDFEAMIYSGKCGNDPAEIAKYLGSKFLIEKSPRRDDLLACILTGTEAHHSTYEYLRGLAAVMPFPLAVSGGTSIGRFPSENMDEIFLGNQYCGNLVTKDSLALLFLRAKKPAGYAFGYGCETGLQAVTPEFECTRAEGNVLYELDGVPVLDFLKMHLGENFKEHLMEQHFTLSQPFSGSETMRSYIRFPWDYLEDRGGIEFWQPETLAGQKLQICHLNREEMVAGARRAAQRALEALHGKFPQMVLVFSCGYRNRHLHSRTDDEILAISEVFGKQVPIVGLYASSEIGPIYSRQADITDPGKPHSGSRQFGVSVSVFAIGADTPTTHLPDYAAMLSGHKSEDAREVHENPQEEIARLRKNLVEYERRFRDNEAGLKCLIQEQFRVNSEMKEKNRELSEAKNRSEKLQEVIRQYTPHSVWWKASVSVFAGLYKIPDEELFATFVFIDVKGFTSFAEGHAPDEVITEINRIFRPATEMIYQFGGDVDKYIGDCILARFEQPDQALQATLAIQKFVQCEIAGSSPFRLRIGMNHGRIVLGNVGAEMRRENAMIGDAVNTAQRLESNCQPGSILISRATFDMIDPALLSGVSHTERWLKLKGKEQEFAVVEVTLGPSTLA